MLKLSQSVYSLKFDYDEPIIGLGCEDKYHNVPGAEEYTHSIQTLSKARDTFHSISELPEGAKVGNVGAGLWHRTCQGIKRK